MIELLTASIVVAGVLGYMLYESKNQILLLEKNLLRSKKDLSETQNSIVISQDDLRKKTIAVYWLLQRDEKSETGYYVERDPSGDNHDSITERYERTLDCKGRCLTEWRHTDCHGMILKTEYEYADNNSDEPTKQTYYDEDGAVDVWIESLLDNEGRTLAYIRHREANSKKDIGFYERDSEGILRKVFERAFVEWAHSLEDIPSKYHSVFDASPIAEYKYIENSRFNPKSPPVLTQIKRGSRIEEIVQFHRSTSQILETDYNGLKKATHYFPSEEKAMITIIIGQNSPCVEVNIDLTFDHQQLISQFIDTTA